MSAQPLALLLHENLLPGCQLVYRLEDLGYRVQTLADPNLLEEHAAQEKPLVLLIELAGQATAVCAAVQRLKANPATGHLPILAFTGTPQREHRNMAQSAGITLIASNMEILHQLPQLLDQVLQLD